jgi:hypothetical protein
VHIATPQAGFVLAGGLFSRCTGSRLNPVKRDKNTGKFMDAKKGEKKLKGVRREKKAA